MSERLPILEIWLNRWIEKINQIYEIDLDHLKLDFLGEAGENDAFEVLMVKTDDKLFLSKGLLKYDDEFVKAFLLYKILKRLPKSGKKWMKVKERIIGEEGDAFYGKIRQIEKMYRGG